MSYNYISQKIRDYDFFVRNTRTLPPSSFGNIKLWETIKTVEGLYRSGKISRKKAALYGIYIKERFGVDFIIISDRHIVFLPRNNSIVESAIFNYPQLIGIFGNRNSGKTITSWTIALHFLERFRNGVIYVYGDVDGLGKSLIYENREYEDRVIVKEEYSLPPVSERPKLALYNELSEELITKRAMSGDNIRLNFQALRNRHRNVWVIYNVIRYTSFESVLRDTVDITFYKWMSPTLLNNLIMNVPRAYADVLKYIVMLEKNESLVMAPIPGRGTYIGIYETNPPEFLLRAHRNASKNIRLMMVKDEKDLYVYERIGELKDKGLSGEEVSILLRKEGINLSPRAVNMRYNKWKKMQKIEVEI